MTNRTDAQKARAYKTRTNANRRIMRNKLADALYCDISDHEAGDLKTAEAMAKTIDWFFHERWEDLWTTEN